MNKGLILGIIVVIIVLGVAGYFYYQSLYIPEEEATIKVNTFLDQNLLINPLEPDQINFQVTWNKKEAILEKGIWSVQMQLNYVLLYEGYNNLPKGYSFNRIVLIKVNGRTGNMITTREELDLALNP